MGNPIWILEHRKNEENRIDSTLAFVSSTIEKSIDWIKKNKDYDSGEFWWVLYYGEVDVDSQDQDIPEKDLFIFNKNGEEIFWQPGSGEDVFQYGDRVELSVHLFSQNLSADSIYQGILIKAEDEKVLFRNLVTIEENGVSVNKPFKDEFSLKIEEIDFIKKTTSVNS